MAERNTPNHILHLLLTLVTAGLWILVWLFVSFRIRSGWRCSQYGSRC